ncbi:cysteine hydrolase family protein [Spirochaetota bacterium]
MDEARKAENGALLVIDVQKGLFAKIAPVFREKELLDNINGLIGRARGLGALVVFIQHCNPSFLAEGSEGWQLHPALGIGPGDLYIKKKHSNAFKDTVLAAELERLEINTIVVAGLVTHGCVQAACLEGKKLGYRVVLISDGHSSWNQEAEKLIAQWNEKLRDEGILVRQAQDVFV